MKYFILGIGILAGCTKPVYLPVSVCPEPKIPVEQQLRVDLLPPKPNTSDILKALAHDHIYLKDLNKQFRIILEGYKQTK